jgi:hypothetical protein
MSNDADNLDPVEPRASRRLSAESAGAVDELQLQRYLDGRLSVRERVIVEDMLKTNAAARRTLSALREEDRLLRDAFEARIEPAKRAGDRVLLTLNNEERFRLNALRSRQLRRQVFAALASAACLFLAVWLIKPRDAAGTALSGTPATLITPSEEKRPITRSARIYEGDQIVTAQGQFLRVQLAGGALLDIDENSRVRLEKDAVPALRLDAGRIGLDCRSARQGMVVNLPQGAARAAAGSHTDLWLPPARAAVNWPDLLAPLPFPAQNADAPQPATAVVTVMSGSVSMAGGAFADGLQLSDGQRVIFTAEARRTDLVNFSASQVFDTRTEKSWHASEGNGPRDYVRIGLLDRPDFVELGVALKLTRKELAPLNDALKLLQEGMLTPDAALRAGKLASGQQALRIALEPLGAADESRHLGRMLEGMAHFERGQALLLQEKPDRPAASIAFAAAAAAFDEARQPVAIPGVVTPKHDKLAWVGQLTAGDLTRTLADLVPFDHSALRAAYYHAIADYWRVQTSPVNEGDAVILAVSQEFASLRPKLGRSTEALCARLGEALCCTFAGNRAKAVDLLQQLLAVSLDGASNASRADGEGLKQAALVELVRLHVQDKELKKARLAARDFAILYPLQSNSPAAREIQRLLESGSAPAWFRFRAASGR